MILLLFSVVFFFFFFSSRRRHTRSLCDWSSDVCSSDLGDTLEVRILKIVPKPDAFNFNLPGKDFPTVGLLAPEFPEGFVRYYKLDRSEERRVGKECRSRWSAYQ